MVFEKIKEIVADQLLIDDYDITMDASLIFDLAADSIDLIEICMELEDEFDIEISDDDIGKIATVGDFVDLVNKKTKE